MRAALVAVGVAALVCGAVPARAGGVITYTAADGTHRIVNVGTAARGTAAVPNGNRSRRDELWPVVKDAAATHGIDPRLVDLVIRMESGYNPRALSPKGARGVMQLMPTTARMYGVRDVWDARDNIRGGTRYLADLLDRFDLDLTLALAAYNAGPEAVERHGGVPPYRETRRYVDRILSAYQSDGGSAVLGGGFGRSAPVRRDVTVRSTAGVPKISNVPPAGDSSLRRRLSLR